MILLVPVQVQQVQSGNTTIIWKKGGDFSPPCPDTNNVPISSL
jgi:hypothetical protein